MGSENGTEKKGLFGNIGAQFAPHAEKLNNTVAAAGVLLHHRLEAIENHLGTLGRPDVGDKYFRIKVSGTRKAEREVIGEVPIDEFWPIQYLATAGGREKTPAFTIELNRLVIFAFNKEGTGQESPGGDVVALPGENIELNPETEGKFEATLIVIRRKLPTGKVPTTMGTTKGKLLPSNTHDPARDVIAMATPQIYSEIGGEQDFEEKGPSS